MSRGEYDSLLKIILPHSGVDDSITIYLQNTMTHEFEIVVLQIPDSDEQEDAKDFVYYGKTVWQCLSYVMKNVCCVLQMSHIYIYIYKLCKCICTLYIGLLSGGVTGVTVAIISY